MQLTNSLSMIQKKFDSYKQLIKKWDFYIAFTDYYDGDYLESIQTINETNIDCLQILNNLDVAFAVRLVLKIIVEQPLELFEFIESSCGDQISQEQKYALDLLKHIIYQLDKQAPLTYLNQLFKNKNIPLFTDQEIKLSKIYSFVQQCDLGSLFQPFQRLFRINLSEDLSEDESNFDFVFYQPKCTFPIFVLMKENLVQLQQQVYDNHLLFLKNIGFQVMLDAMSQKLSQTTVNLNFQPFRYESIEDLAKAICFGQFNFEDKVAKFKKIPKMQKLIYDFRKKFLQFLIQPGYSVSYYLQLIKDQQEEEKQIKDPFEEEKIDYDYLFRT